MDYIVIMAGGVGSRFWPSSRNHFPKQFLDVLGLGKSLLQMTFERFEKLVPASRILILTNEAYLGLIQEQLPKLPANNILCEPSRNNTAPCVAYAALHLQARDPQATFVVAPSDHLILKEDLFLEKVKQGLDFVRKTPSLLTLGIQPSHPNTGYGYIHFRLNNENNAPSKVLKFTEKPDATTAEQFIASGDYLWNAGIFIWTASSILAAFEQHASDVFDVLNAGKSHYNTSSEKAFIEETYPKTPNISIDYAILEKADNIYTLPADIGWSDLGTWASLYEQLPQDDQQNAIVDAGLESKVLCLDSTHCLIRESKDKVVIIKDLHNYIIVDEEDVLLIYPKDKEQEVKQIAKKVGDNFGDKYL